MEAIASLWCVPCAMDGWDDSLATVQHVVEARKRLGHRYTYGACTWHHLGDPPKGESNDDAAAKYGPSLKHEPRRYQEVYAPERELVKIMDHLLEIKSQIELGGSFMTTDQFGLFVRQEVFVRLGRSVSLTR